MTILKLKSKLQEFLPGSTWTLPPDLSKGVLATNYAFVEAKKQSVNPVDLAARLVEDLNLQLSPVAPGFKAVGAGPFINIVVDFETLDQSSFDLPLEDTFETNGKVIVQDMFHPNVGKKMHVGHIRSGNLGEAMRRVLCLRYENVVSDNHLGDWGVQFSYTIWGIRHLQELNLDFQSIDLETEENKILIDKFYKIYVKVNGLIETDEEIKSTARGYAKTLEKGLLGRIELEKERVEFEELFSLYEVIIKISLEQFVEAEQFFELKQLLL
jgi:arginyl-tRNA synthetase